MNSWRRNLFWVWASLFLAMAGFGFAYPVLPFFLVDGYGVTDPGTRDFFVAMFAFAGNFGFLLFSPLWGRLADHYGRKMMMTRANACSAVLLPLIAVMPGPWWLVSLRFCIGAFAGVASAALTLVACSTPEKHRGMAMGAISSAIFSGNLAGTVAGGFCASAFGYSATFGCCGAIMLVAAFISLTLVEERNRPVRPAAPVQLLPRWHIPRLGKIWYLMLLMLAMGYVQQVDGPFLPILVDLVLQSDSSEALRWSGILGGACAAAGIAGGFLIGMCADRFAGDKVGLVICIAGAVFMLPQAFCGSLGWLFGERMLMTFFVSGLSPITQSWLSLTTRAEDRGSYFGYATSFRALGWLAGGVGGMAVTYWCGTRAVFASAALSLLLMAALLHWVQKKLPFPLLRKKIKN